MFFGIENQHIDLSDIDFTVKIASLVEANLAQEKELNDILKSATEDEEEKEGEEKEPSSAECLRKAKLSNQFGSMCLKAENYDKAARLFEQAIKSFEQYKYLEMHMQES